MCGYCRSVLVRLLAKDIFVRKNNYSHSWKDKSCILEGSLQMICTIMLLNSLISHLSPFLHFVLSQWLSIPKWNCQNQFAIHVYLLQWLKDCLRLFFFLNLLICNWSSNHSMFRFKALRAEQVDLATGECLRWEWKALVGWQHADDESCSYCYESMANEYFLFLVI